jgi:hypothetical protein
MSKRFPTDSLSNFEDFGRKLIKNDHSDAIKVDRTDNN